MILSAWGAVLFLAPAFAQSDPFKSTPYPVPRFVSLNSEEINVRTGPGAQYPIKWVFVKKHLPVEVVLEYDSWRKIKDRTGEEGWVHGSLLSGRRYGLIQSEEGTVTVFSKPQSTAKPKLRLQPGVRLRLLECKESWCRGEIAENKGWVEKKFIWGVYETENFK